MRTTSSRLIWLSRINPATARASQDLTTTARRPSCRHVGPSRRQIGREVVDAPVVENQPLAIRDFSHEGRPRPTTPVLVPQNRAHLLFFAEAFLPTPSALACYFTCRTVKPRVRRKWTELPDLLRSAIDNLSPFPAFRS